MTSAPKIHPLEAVVLAALFAAAISLPLVKQLSFGEPDTSIFEKRITAKMPALAGSLKWRIKNLPQKLDAYYADHFGFRSLLLQGDFIIKSECFHISQWADIGTNGFLFYKLTPPLFTQSLSAADLAKWKSYLEHRQKWLADKGIRYLFVVPPDKDSIYPEYLPLTSRLPPPELPVDQLIRYLKETHSDVDIISLREPLLAAKTQEHEFLYYKQDSHWNSLGGFYGYQAIINHLAKSFPSLKPKSRADYRLTFAPDDFREIVLYAGLWNFARQTGPVLKPLTPELAQKTKLPLKGFQTIPFFTQIQSPAGLPSAVVKRDSFTVALEPYLSENFSRITYFWPFLDSREQEKIIADTLLKEKPDIFIEERIQRFITINLPDESIMFGGDTQAGPGKANP